MILIKKNGQLIPVGLTVGGIKKEKWARPDDWLPIPEFDSEKDDVYILVGVGKANINCIYFDAQMKSGTGTIDWGDGSPTEIITTTNTTFNHNWSYEDTPDSTYTEHNKTKQALIHITCDRDTFAGIDFNKTHYYTNEDNVEVAYNSNTSNLIYEVKADCESVSKFNVQSTSSSSSIKLYNLENFDWKGEITITDMRNMFDACYSLQSIPQLDTSSVTSMTLMFGACYSLQSIPQLDTSSVTDMKQMFIGCHSLQSIPQLDTSSVIDMGGMFDTCYSLQSIPQLDTSSVTGMRNMFNSCHSLQSIPQLDTSSVIDMRNMFNYCYLLQKLITYNAGASSQSNILLQILNSTMLTKQQLVDLFNSVAVTPSGKIRGLQLGSTLQGYLSNCYVKDSGVLDTYILPTRDTTIVSGKTYYTYDDVTGEYTQVTPDFTTDTFYYELVTATWNKYVICESTDTGAMLALDYIRNIKGWTVS